MKKISDKGRFNILVNQFVSCHRDIKKEGDKLSKGNRSVRVFYSPSNKDTKLIIRHKGNDFYIPVGKYNIADYEGLKDTVFRALRIK